MVKPWRKLWRDVLEHPVFVNDPKGWRIFEALILLADDDGNWSGGIMQLAARIREKKTTVFDGLVRLENQTMIERRPNAKFTVYHICNWAMYQDTTPNDARPTAERYPNADRHSYIMKELDKDIDTENTGARTAEFDLFWNEYPSKKGKIAALRAWQRSKDKPTIESVVASIQKQKQSQQWRRGYIPNPATSINQGRWDDEEEAPVHTYKPEELDFRTAAEKARSKA